MEKIRNCLFFIKNFQLLNKIKEGVLKEGGKKVEIGREGWRALYR